MLARIYEPFSRNSRLLPCSQNAGKMGIPDASTRVLANKVLLAIVTSFPSKRPDEGWAESPYLKVLGSSHFPGVGVGGCTPLRQSDQSSSQALDEGLGRAPARVFRHKRAGRESNSFCHVLRSGSRACIQKTDEVLTRDVTVLCLLSYSPPLHEVGPEGLEPSTTGS